MKSPVLSVFAFFALFSSVAAYVGCSTDDAVHEPAPADAGKAETGATTDDGSTGDGGIVPDNCFMNPTTHFEIINACTDAARVDKKPPLPLLLADGGLPPPP